MDSLKERTKAHTNETVPPKLVSVIKIIAIPNKVFLINLLMVQLDDFRFLGW